MDYISRLLFAQTHAVIFTQLLNGNISLPPNLVEDASGNYICGRHIAHEDQALVRAAVDIFCSAEFANLVSL